jgi:nitrate/nitrite transport system ATP-binding protein
MQLPHLELSQVSIEFENEKGRFCALKNVSLKIQRGEFISFIGHSGCGKSTLLNIVAGLYQTTSGAVILNGKQLNEPSPECAVVFQNHALLPWLSVYENVALGVRAAFKGKKSKKEMHEWILYNIERVNMTHAQHKKPDQISGGMKQRVGIARALALEPEVLLMDEPFGALDALTRAQLQDALIDIRHKLGNTVIMITHDIDEAVLLSDRVVMMTQGPNANIGEILEVQLEHPRQRLAVFDQPLYHQYRSNILHFLYAK